MPRVNENLRKAILHIRRGEDLLKKASSAKRLKQGEKQRIIEYNQDISRIRERIERFLMEREVKKVPLKKFLKDMETLIKREYPSYLDNFKKFEKEIYATLEDTKLPTPAITMERGQYLLYLGKGENVELAVENFVVAVNTETLDQYIYDFLTY